MKKKLLILLLIAAAATAGALALAGCFGGDSSGNNGGNIKKIEMNYTEAQVKEILGAPDDEESRYKRFCWHGN